MFFSELNVSSQASRFVRGRDLVRMGSESLLEPDWLKTVDSVNRPVEAVQKIVIIQERERERERERA